MNQDNGGEPNPCQWSTGTCANAALILLTVVPLGGDTCWECGDI